MKESQAGVSALSETALMLPGRKDHLGLGANWRLLSIGASLGQVGLGQALLFLITSLAPLCFGTCRRVS